MNIILASDSYKASHWLQMPPATSRMTYYLESRGGRYNATMFAGLQILLAGLSGRVVSQDHIELAASLLGAHGEPFHREGWELLLSRHGGRLPIRIRAVAEGTVVPAHNVLMTVENTDPDFFWLPSYLETMLLRAVWYPTTVATRSYYCKRVIHRYLKETSDAPLAELPFKLHDFGARGVSSAESAAIGGCAHLFNFMGSDTLEGIEYAQRYYGCEGGMPAFSIPAAEHSTITSWGREREVASYRNIVQKFAKPGKIFAAVSDSYDLMHVVENVWGGELKKEVEESGATLVVRPDSGHPPTVVLQVVQALARSCGESMNACGYRVLPKWVRVIQGDGNENEEDIEAILTTLKVNGFSASNVAFGMGGGLLQKLDRDTNRFAYKCSEAVVDGVPVKVFKDPKTDPGKRSKGGRLSLVHRGGKYQTVEGDAPDSLLVPVFEDGEVLKTYTLDEVRKVAGREFT